LIHIRALSFDRIIRSKWLPQIVSAALYTTKKDIKIKSMELSNTAQLMIEFLIFNFIIYAIDFCSLGRRYAVGMKKKNT